MPNSRGGVCSAFLDGKLYAIGGEGRSTVDVYDPLNNSWSSGPSLPYVVDGAAAITHQNKLYVIGGGSMATVRDSVFELNSTSNTWIQKASMPTARVGLRLLEHEGKIWAIGGYHATNGAQSIVEIYDPSSDSWVSGTSLNTERSYPVVWKQHGNLFVGGGQAKDNSFLSSVEYFDIQNGQWKDAGNLPEPKRAASAKVVDGKIYIVAGSTANGVYSNKLHAADFLPNRDLYFRSAASQSNRGPANLNVIGSLNFAENQPIGTIVGEFNATDPDANSTLTYYLVSGAGDTHNSLFTLETNGTLRTATIFDYESNASTYTIRVQAKDEFNAATEGNFTVMLTGVYEPSQPNHFVDLNSSVNLEMIWVEPGAFTMGSPVTEVGREDDENQTLVTLTKGFYLGKYEVTQAQYEAVMTGDSSGLSATPSQFGGNPNRPVEKVSWEDAQVFLTRLNEAEQMAGRLPVGWSYVLPTESQWEYACRAGKNTEYSLGNVITSSNVNYNRIIGQTTNVGTYAPNYWGFYDMHGNVLEWTADWYQVAYPVGNPVIDPIGPSSGSYRVLRGGSWASEALFCALLSVSEIGGSTRPMTSAFDSVFSTIIIHLAT